MRLQGSRTLRPDTSAKGRRGTVIIMTAVCLILVMAMVAFAVDIGYIAQAKTQLQNASDAAALAGALELYDGLGPGTTSPSAVSSAAKTAATAVAASNPAADTDGVYLASSDIVLGRRVWDATGGYTDAWNTAPYNLVQVTARRNAAGSAYSDGPISTFFARVLGHDEVSISASSKVVLNAAAGFRIASGSSETADVLPIAYDLPSWNSYLAGSGGSGDNYSWNGANVQSGSDGIREIDLYPYGNQALTPGNRGTVDLGNPNNSTADLKRQILYGLNASDLSYFDGELRTDNGPLQINGDTGISAGIKDQLQQIIGETRSIPIFSAVSGPGNNAQYTVVKFVGVRIMYVKLTGGSKKVVVQPAPVFDSTAIPATSTSSFDYVFVPPRLTK